MSDMSQRITTMRTLLQSLGFRIDDSLSDLMGLLKAAQQYRSRTSKTVTDEVTRSTALAVIIHRSPDIRDSLTSFGLRCQEYLDSIGLKQLPITHTPEKDVAIHASFEDALNRYARSEDAILETSDDVFAIAILEDAVSNLRDDFTKDLLEGRLRTFGIDAERLSEALRLRTLPFDARRQVSGKDRSEQTELGQYERIVRPFGDTVVRPLGETAPAPASQIIQSTGAVSLEAIGTHCRPVKNRIDSTGYWIAGMDFRCRPPGRRGKARFFRMSGLTKSVEQY